MTGHDLDPIIGARQAVAAGCAEIAPVVMWAYLDGVVKEYDALAAKLAAAEQERDQLRADLAESSDGSWEYERRYNEAGIRADRAEAALAAVRELADRTRTFGGSDIEGWVNLWDLRRALAAAEQNEPRCTGSWETCRVHVPDPKREQS